MRGVWRSPGASIFQMLPAIIPSLQMQIVSFMNKLIMPPERQLSLANCWLPVCLFYWSIHPHPESDTQFHKKSTLKKIKQPCGCVTYVYLTLKCSQNVTQHPEYKIIIDARHDLLTSTVSSWWRGTVVERRSLAGELSLSCARPAADGWPLMWVKHPLQVSQLGQLSPFWVDKWVVSWNQMCAAVYR